MARKQGGVPSLRRHKRLGQGVVRLNGRDYYCGVWPAGQPVPAAVRAKYDQHVREWLARGRCAPPAQRARAAASPAGRAEPGGNGAVEAPPAPAALTVAELLAAYLRHAREYYRHPDGSPTTEYHDIVLSLRPVAHLYAALPAAEFSPLKLQAARGLMMDGYEHPDHGTQKPLARKLINQRVGRTRRAWKWGVARELVPAGTYQALLAVEGLKGNRSAARETAPVLPVPMADLERTLPQLPPHASGLVRFLLHTGARCGEACQLVLADVDRSADVWLFAPRRHKAAWRNKPRVIAIGPRGQEVLREFICIRCPLCGVEGRPPAIGSRDGALCGPCADRMDEQDICGPWQCFECHAADFPLFSPAAQREEIHAAMRAKRKTKVQPSQVCRKKAKAQRLPGASFGVAAVDKAVRRAARRAGVPHWHPHQLRHLHGARARAAAGLDGAQAVLGHATPLMTEHYSRLQAEKAADVARRIG